MLTTQKRLNDLTADDVMSRHVKTIPEEMPLQEAARMLAREHVSGAPVVNPQGKCVGVLSAIDFVRWADKGTEPAPAKSWPSYCSDWQMVDLHCLPKDAVRTHMSADVVTARPTDPITKLARMMIDAHIHRIVVTDAERRPIGIVSSTDILAAVARLEPDVDE
jgi:CBS-domain-containing membrane protein